MIPLSSLGLFWDVHRHGAKMGGLLVYASLWSGQWELHRRCGVIGMYMDTENLSLTAIYQGHNFMAFTRQVDVCCQRNSLSSILHGWHIDTSYSTAITRQSNPVYILSSPLDI